MKNVENLDHKYICELLSKRTCSRGQNLSKLIDKLPFLFVFLRQLGCAFCHRTLIDLKVQQRDIQLEGAEIVLIHMAPMEEADEVFDLYGLNNVLSIRDPEQELYRSFGLRRGKLHHVFSPRIWLNSITAKSLSDDELSPMLGDPLQMPGVFLFYKGRVIRGFWHRSVADRPSYVEMAKFPFPTETLLKSDQKLLRI